MPAPINTSLRKCAVSKARVVARYSAIANHSGVSHGIAPQAITATQNIVSAWPDGKELYWKSKRHGMKPYSPSSSSSRGRRRPRNIFIVCRIALPMARLARNASDISESIANAVPAPSKCRPPHATRNAALAIASQWPPLAQSVVLCSTRSQRRCTAAWKKCAARRSMAKLATPPTSSRSPAHSSMIAACRVALPLSTRASDAAPQRLESAQRYNQIGGTLMDFDYSPRQKEWMKRVGDFMEQHMSIRRRPSTPPR